VEESIGRKGEKMRARKKRGKGDFALLRGASCDGWHVRKRFE